MCVCNVSIVFTIITYYSCNKNKNYKDIKEKKKAADSTKRSPQDADPGQFSRVHGVANHSRILFYSRILFSMRTKCEPKWGQYVTFKHKTEQNFPHNGFQSTLQ